MMLFVVKQSVTQRLISQRSRFTRKSPVVAAATFLPNFLKFWAPPYHLKLFDLVRSCFDSEYQITACFQRSFMSNFRVGSKVN